MAKRTTSKPSKNNSSFDGIADKFDKNIYGTSKGRLRHKLLLHYLQSHIEQNSISVLDVGAGTGEMSAEFAKFNHQVHLVDVSLDTLTMAKQKLSDYSNLSYEHNDLFTLEGKYDLVLCHAVLEWLADPYECIDKLNTLLSDEGTLSLSFFNRDAKEFGNLIYGNFDYVEQGMPNKNTVRLNPSYPHRPLDIIRYIKQISDLEIVLTAGIRCIHDYVHEHRHIEENNQQLLRLELEYGNKEPFKYLGKYFYIQVKKRLNS